MRFLGRYSTLTTLAKGRIRDLYQRSDRHVFRNLLPYVAVVFATLGVVLIIWAKFVEDQYIQGVLLNVGTEFFGGVILATIFWFVDFKPRRTQGIDYLDLTIRFQKAKREIRILSTFTYLFSESSPSESLANDQIEVARTVLLERLRRDPSCSAKVLVLNPYSEAATRRQQERPEVDIHGLLEENIRFLHGLQSSGLHKTLNVRVYSALPRVAMIQVDDYLSISFFERNTPISKTERYEFSVASPMARFFESSFEAVWKDPETITLTEFFQTQNGMRNA